MKNYKFRSTIIINLMYLNYIYIKKYKFKYKLNIDRKNRSPCKTIKFDKRQMFRRLNKENKFLQDSERFEKRLIKAFKKNPEGIYIPRKKGV